MPRAPGLEPGSARSGTHRKERITRADRDDTFTEKAPAASTQTIARTSNHHRIRLVRRDLVFASQSRVAGHPGGPLDHFLDIGAAEQRAAGPRFDTRSYLAANPDVIESRTNPLVHYIRHGISEGRGFASNRPLSAGRRGTKLGLAVDVTFSLIIKAGQPADVKTTLKSLVAQSAPIFEVIFPGSAVQAIGAFHERLAIRAVRADEDFLRAAILSAEHEFVIVLDAGDVLAVDALLILSRFLNDRADRSQACDVVYSDESQGIRRRAGA